MLDFKKGDETQVDYARIQQLESAVAQMTNRLSTLEARSRASGTAGSNGV